MERKVDRLDKYLKTKRLSTNKLSVMAGLSTGIISKSREPNRDLSNSSCEKILSVLPDLNPEWLYEGTGEMLKLDIEPTSSISQTINGIGDNHIKITTMDKAIEEIAAQRKLTEEALRQNKDLVDIIKNLTSKK